MKKIIIVFMIVLLTGCKNSNNAKDEVINYLESYINLSHDIDKEIDDIIDSNHDFNKTHKNSYKKILKNQFKTLKYEILSEDYSGDIAHVKVNITVTNLYESEKEALDYLTIHLNEFYNEDNIFDTDKYISYKLELMNNNNSKIDYELDFVLNYNGKKWILVQPTDEDILKIEGLYKNE